MSKKALGVHSEAGKLHKVMVCSPGLAHLRLTPNNCDELLFDDVIWVSQAKRDHFDFVQDRSRWGYSFRFGLFAISDHDMRLIADAMGADARSLGF